MASKITPAFEYDVRGVKVHFPYEAYPLQQDLMARVIQCLQQKTNGLIESPTGTGKTLCLLCAVLAWRAAETLATGKAPGKVFYASRTHSQLAQVVGELGNTVYRPKIAVLGSREQMCVQAEVRAAPSARVQNNMCRHRVTKRQCEFYGGVEQQLPALRAAQEQSLLDMESLVALGTQQQFCPFYAAREFEKEADVVFLPYNYVVDAQSRRGQKLELNDAIVIFDEGHNLESTCTDAASFAVTTRDLSECDRELRECVILASSAGKSAEAASFEQLQGSISRLLAAVRGLPLDSRGQATHPGSLVLRLLAGAGLDPAQNEVWAKTWDDAAAMLVEARATQRSAGGLGCALATVLAAVSAVFRYDSAGGESAKRSPLDVLYRIHIQAAQPGRGAPRQPPASGATERVLSFWCFSAGVAMRSLVAAGVRSLLVASGTLSPLETMADELSVPFPVTLEGPHVIKPEQLLVAAVVSGPAGTALNSSFTNRDNPKYIADLGNTVAEVCRLAPDGVLVFFASYSLLDETLRRWREPAAGRASAHERLARYKHVFVEPRSKADLPETMRAYNAAIEQPSGGRTGAILFAVCRGKLSEGVDFSDRRARVVVVCGIPYPAAREPRIVLKRQILDSNGTAQTGQKWYTQQAARAVNQALGRAIRHRHDYGVVLLCDERFGTDAQRRQLPFWVRGHVRRYGSFGPLATDMASFFAAARSLPRPVRPAVATGGAPHARRPLEPVPAAQGRPAARPDAHKARDALILRSWRASQPASSAASRPTSQPAPSSNPQLPAGTQRPLKQGKEGAVAFLERLRATITADDYREFQRLLRKFKAGEATAPEFLGTVYRVIRQHASVALTRELMGNFKAFLPRKHHSLLDGILFKMSS